ncbi:MAG: CHASE2 domain-containing protein [Pseudomonadota bacterium]
MALFSSSTRYRAELLVLFVVLVGFAALATDGAWLRSLDRILYDLSVRLRPAALDDRLVIVGIDEQTLTRVGRWPWNRAQQAELLDAVAAQVPLALFVDVVYSGETLADEDAALVDAFDRFAHVAVPMIVDVPAVGQPPLEILPFDGVIRAVTEIGHVHLELDDDSISRGTFLYQGVGNPAWPHAMLALARTLGVIQEPLPDGLARCAELPQEASIRLARCGYALLPFAGPPGTVPQLSALALLDGSLPSQLLAGKIVLLGLTTAGVADWVTSPVSGRGRPISGVEFNANLLNALIAGELIERAPRSLTSLISVLIAAIAALSLPRLTPKAMLGVTLLLIISPMLATAALMAFQSLYLPTSAGSLAALLAYPYWSWRRHEIAWRYVDGEMERLAETSALLDTSPPMADTARWRSRLGALATLLRLSIEDASAPAHANDTRTWATVDGERALHARLPDGSALVLRGANDGTFSEAEIALIHDSLNPLMVDDQHPRALPGEGLAARIRLLQREADRVRASRDTGLKALDEMRSGVLVLSPQGDVEFVNSAFAALVPMAGSVDAPSVLKRLGTGLPTPLGSNWEEIWRVVVVAGESRGFETRLPSQRVAYVYCARLDPELGDRLRLPDWAVIITDITEIRTAESQREEALAFVSHDLRSPILSILALVRRDLSSDESKQIERYAEKSLQVSEQFLQLSRLESQRDVETYELDVIDALENACDQVYEQAREARILLDRSSVAAADEPVWVRGNGQLLERAFINLLSNAIKYSPADRQVWVVLELEETWLTVAVVDEGRGIPEADLPQLFESFFRSSDPELARQRGSGLGLRFTKTVAERHGGTLTVESTLGAGSTFRFRLPRLPIDSDLQ